MATSDRHGAQRRANQRLIFITRRRRKALFRASLVAVILGAAACLAMWGGAWLGNRIG